MRVIIHAGMNKTGSTSIQQYLAASRGPLRQAGMLYPDPGYADHWPLIAALSPTGVTGYLARRQASGRGRRATDGAIDRFKAELAAAPDCDTLILSHEGFSAGLAGSRLLDFLKPIVGHDADIRLIAYARSPIDLFPSVVQHGLKSRGSKELLPSAWRSNHPARGARLRETFGDALTLRAYARELLPDGDVVADFRQWLTDRAGRAAPPPSADKKANVAFSAPACALLQLWQLEVDRDGGNRDFRPLKRLATTAPAPGASRKLVMPGEWHAPIAARNGRSWNRLVDLMDYPLETRERLKLPTAAPSEETQAGSRDWVLSYLDAEFVTGVIAFARQQTWRDAANLVATIEWLSSVRRRLTRGKLGPARSSRTDG